MLFMSVRLRSSPTGLGKSDEDFLKKAIAVLDRVPLIDG